MNFLSWYGLCLSLRTTLPILNGFVLPEAPVFVRDRLFPFLYFISEPFMVPFRYKPRDKMFLDPASLIRVECVHAAVAQHIPLQPNLKYLLSCTIELVLSSEV
jgi:hypothetical protein